VDSQVEFGRTIRITHRNQVRNVASNYNIADSNTEGDLKPKGKVENEWCRYYP